MDNKILNDFIKKIKIPKRREFKNLSIYRNEELFSGYHEYCEQYSTEEFILFAKEISKDLELAKELIFMIYKKGYDSFFKYSKIMSVKMAHFFTVYLYGIKNCKDFIEVCENRIKKHKRIDAILKEL